MEDFIKRGKSEKVDAKTGKNFQSGGKNFLAGQNIYPWKNDNFDLGNTIRVQNLNFLKVSGYILEDLHLVVFKWSDPDPS